MNNLNTARISIAQRPEVKVPIDDTATSALEMFGTESNVIDTANQRTASSRVTTTAPPFGGEMDWGDCPQRRCDGRRDLVTLQRTTAVAPGSLTLNTVPPGLEVSLGGKLAGVTR